MPPKSMMQDNCKEKSELLGKRSRQKMLKEENILLYTVDENINWNTLCGGKFVSIYENLKCVYSLTQ